MAGNYYFEQWKRVLKNLESVISIDIDNQKNKAHDKDICDASLRLSGVLGSYVCCYNATFDCLQQNLQVQKTAYMENVVKALLTRILELKEQLRKLERTCYEYLSEGLIEYKLTPYDVELENIYFKNHRPRDIQRLVDDALREAKAVAHKDLMAEEVEESVGFEEEDRWWETDNEQVETKSKGINVGAIYAVEKKMSQETLKRKQLLSLIQAHEKSRQTIQEYTLRNERRLLWEKELKGTLNPPARVELRERASLLIQTIIRKYFHLKRKKVTDCKLDQLLGINYCKQIKDLRDVKEEENKIKSKTCELKKMYNNKWKLEYKELKTKFIKKKEGDIADDFREFIRCWFKTWFEEVQFFHAIPKENQGGITRIIKNEISSPAEWLDEYNAYLEQKKATKHKTATQLKYEKLEAKREEMEFKREAMKKKKLQIELMRKLMKNPNIHPGYQYPESKKIEHLIEAVAVYKNKWSEWDDLNIVKVKKGHIREVDFEEICATVKEEICNSVENDMRLEYKTLMAALEEDYKRNEEVMPENIKEKIRVKKKRKSKRKLLKIMFHLKTYLIVNPFGGETRCLWWEKCRELTHGFSRILLVGAKNTGKTILVHAMASVNEASFYELNLRQLQDESLDTLKQISSDLIICARATQPSVIYIRHVHKLYYRKVKRNEDMQNSNIIKKLIIKKLIRKLHKTDSITLIGSCIDPWLTKSKQVIKHFPNVILMPPTSYSAAQLVLRNWVSRNRIIPPALDVQSLAYVLQGYAIGQLIKQLDNFLTAERIVQIATQGLSPTEVYDHFLQNDEAKVDYERYHKWNSEKTHWGKVEKKHLEEQLEFRQNIERWKEKIEKQKKKQ